jgi:Mlc titration factor MtfA (ptsG expression regulator)
VTVADVLRALVIRAFGFLAPRRPGREALAAQPLPRPLEDLLRRRSRHYRCLPADVRAEFDRQIRTFLAEKQVTPVKARVTEEIRLLTAASAVTLTCGWPGFTWDALREVLIYPKVFDDDYRFVEADSGEPGHRAHKWQAAGQAHGMGVVILVKPMLLRSFEIDDEGYHVGFHEFAHLLDLAMTQFDGIPSYLTDEGAGEWTALLSSEEARLRSGDSVLDPYGLSHPTELFAVAVEAFFQRPRAMADRHAELYAFLAAYFNQDPASWTTVPTTAPGTG